nr:hypothetical protein [Okeania sp. SIO2F4]
MTLFLGVRTQEYQVRSNPVEYLLLYSWGWGVWGVWGVWGD